VNRRLTSNQELPAVENFLHTVAGSGVLSWEELEIIISELPEDVRQDTEAVADHLVASGKLSRFQAGKLLRGISLGLVLGPFHVLAPIARGGMGIVYLARDSRSDALVALKVLPPKKAQAKERMLARFQREMEMSQLVSHPHVAFTYEVGLSQGVHFLAMEYIPGKNLYQLVNEEGQLPVARAARLFAEVASALDHAHYRGLIHRDLKPSNIMVTPHDHAKLLDLGLAIVRGQESGDRKLVNGKRYLVGTKDYLAPEQAADPTSVDARADIYALGCTLYFALTGQPPFPGGTTQEKIDRHKSDEPIPVAQLNPNVPAAFIGLVRHMMAKNPERRIASAALVRERLLPWAGSDQEKPLDRREDKEYQEAVFALETLESPPELLTDVVSRTIPERPRHRRRQRSKSRPLLEASHEPAKAHPFAASFVAAISAALLTTLLMGGVLFWLSRH
jgi:serine/threonine protein kinase